mgnify:CR=1 FL=1
MEGHPGDLATVEKSAASGAVAARLLAGQPAMNDGAGATDSRRDLQCCHRAVLSAGAALHAEVKVDNTRLAFAHLQDTVGADLRAQATTDAQFSIELESGDFIQIT